MRPLVRVTLLASLVALAACVENTAPGNDREAEREPPSPPAEVASAASALSGVATALLMPEIMTDADLGTLPEVGEQCTFRMTRVGLPVFVYGSTGVIKLNQKLIPLEGLGSGRYASGPVDVTVRPLEEAVEDGSQFPAELVLRLQGASNELGFHGFSEC